MKSPAIEVFGQQFVQVYINENINARVTGPLWVDPTGDSGVPSQRNSNLDPSLRPRKNDRHFPEDIFKYVFWNENVYVSIKISPKFNPGCPIN